DRSLVVVQHADDVGPGKDDADFERHLGGIRALGYLVLFRGGSSLRVEQITPLLLRHCYLVVHTARPRADFGRRGDEEAPPREHAALDVGEIAIAQRHEALTSWFGSCQCGGDHLFDEAASSRADRW